MANVIEITDFSAPELDVYARLTEAQLLNRFEPAKGMFIAESPKVIHRALDGGYEPVSLLMERKDITGAAREVISISLGLSAVMLTSSGAIKAMLFLMALAVAAFLASRLIFRRDIDKALQAEKAAAEEKSTETATPAETVPAEPEEESNEKKKEEA